MYVSMNPSGETGKAIHISQDDTNREVEFIPFDQNGLVKTTSDETVAHINSIKGNTVSFNQLLEPVMATRTVNGVTCTNNGDGSFTLNGTSSGGSNFRLDQSDGDHDNLKSYVAGKYYCRMAPIQGCYIAMMQQGTYQTIAAFNGNDIVNAANDKDSVFTYFRVDNGVQLNNVKIQPQIFNLTLMGIDNLTTTAQVEAWLSTHIGDLPYYDYTQGTLIPFMGSGLKTEGKNLFDKTTSTATRRVRTDNGVLENQSGFTASTYTRVIANQTYTLNFVYSSLANYGMAFYDGDKKYISGRKQRNNVGDTYFTFTVPSNAVYIRFTINDVISVDDVQLELGSTPSAYEPYTSNTLSLPISTYFPTGMKDVPDNAIGSGYVTDELLENKAKTKIGSYTFTGSEPFVFSDNNAVFSLNTTNYIPNIKMNTVSSGYNINNARCNNRVLTTQSSVSLNTPYSFAFSKWGNVIYLYFSIDGFASADALKAWLASNTTTIYYELETPTETDISLDLTYPVWQNGTEQILPVNGSVPTTSPIKANITYPDRTEDTEFLYKQTSFVFIPRTWAFVCKNITQALTLVGNVLKGTIPSTMTSESGKFPLKLKMTDEDGDVFSEKIDLFVERKP